MRVSHIFSVSEYHDLVDIAHKEFLRILTTHMFFDDGLAVAKFVLDNPDLCNQRLIRSAEKVANQVR